MSVWDRGREAAERSNTAADQAERQRIASLYGIASEQLEEWSKNLGVTITNAKAIHVPYNRKTDKEERIETAFDCEGRSLRAVSEGWRFHVTLEGRFVNTLEQLGQAVIDIEQGQLMYPPARKSGGVRRFFR